jgi:hypothetical protein
MYVLVKVMDIPLSSIDFKISTLSEAEVKNSVVLRGTNINNSAFFFEVPTDL